MSLALLAIQAERSFDARGRVVGLYGVVIARADDGEALFIGADVPDAVAEELAASPAGGSLERCRRILAGGDALPVRGGPSFLVDEGVRFTTDVRIVRSDGAHAARLRGANPGNWQPLEWDELIDGRLGPWAMALDGDRVVSIAHTPAPPTVRAAECGVWTDPAFRGRGYAAATTSAWAELVRPSGRHLFYSTDADNRSSQRVAARLRLRPLGSTWRLGRVRPDGDERVHPLSALRYR